jgi:hypothetical protein
VTFPVFGSLNVIQSKFLNGLALLKNLTFYLEPAANCPSTVKIVEKRSTNRRIYLHKSGFGTIFVKNNYNPTDNNFSPP